MKLQTNLEQDKEPKRKGRPLLEGRRVRDKPLQLRLSEEEHAILSGQARAAGMTFTAYIVSTLIPNKIPTEGDLAIRINGQLHMFDKQEAKSIVNQILNQLTQ